MHFKKYPARVIRDLSDWSCEVSTLNTWSKDGFSERDYKEFLRVTDQFLKLLLKYKPSELVESMVEKK